MIRVYAMAAIRDETWRYGEAWMIDKQSADQRLKVAEDRIQWFLEHPGMSDWVKGALRTARDRNPVDVLNDLEILNTLLRPRAEALVDRTLVRSGKSEPVDRVEGDGIGSSRHS